MNLGMEKTLLTANCGWKADEFYYNNKKVTASQLGHDLNVLRPVDVRLINDDNMQTLIQNYGVYDQTGMASPCIAAWDTGHMDNNSIAYANGIQVSSLSDGKGIMPLVMVNGNFVDKTGVILYKGGAYADADFIKYNLGSGTALTSILKLNINGKTCYQLSTLTQKLGMKMQYTDNFRKAPKDSRGVSIISIESKVPDKLVKYSQQQALDVIKKAYDNAYHTDYPVFPEEQRAENLHIDGMLGRYYVIRNGANSQGYYLLFNPYTGEIFEDGTYATTSFRVYSGIGTQLVAHDAVVEETKDKIIMKNYGFALQLPISWKDKFAVLQKSNPMDKWANFLTVEVYDRLNKKDGFGGTLVTFGRIQTESLKDVKEKYLKNINYEVIGEGDAGANMGGYTYICYKPANIQYNDKDSTAKAEYLKMQDDLKNIKDLLKISN